MEKAAKRWTVPAAEKLVSFLQKKVGGSGKGIRRILEANGCRINGRIERFGSTRIKGGDVVEFFPNEKPGGSFETLFENEDLQIVNKPAGWVCDDGSCRRTFGSSVFLVHRLDKDTTGALLLAKNIRSRDALMALFSGRLVEKEYWALVDGVVRADEGIVETTLLRKGSFEGQTIWGSGPRGDLAITRWKVLGRGLQASLLLCAPETGRTHQIRVHLSEMGHPILVDRQYARVFRSSLFAPRPLLHAHLLRFVFQEKVIEAVAPIPQDFQGALSMAGIKR